MPQYQSFAQRFFGIFIKDDERDKKILRSPVTAPQDTSAIEIGSPMGAMEHRVQIQDNSYRSENDLINKYRDASITPILDGAIGQIVAEAIVNDDQVPQIVTLKFPEKSKVSKALQIKLNDEMKVVLDLLDFRTKGYDIFRRWYVDGRLHFHKVVDEADLKSGIQQLRYIDPRKIKLVRQHERDPKLPHDQFAALNSTFIEFWIFAEEGIDAGTQTYISNIPQNINALKLTKDAIAFSTSGLWDPTGKMIISHLHKTLRILNQYRMLEDSILIYRLTRASEKRKFLIDVGNLPKAKAEQAFVDIMQKFKNKLTYNSGTGEINEDRRFIAMTEDYWFAIREGAQKSDVVPFPGAQNVGIIDDLVEFKENLYRALNVPIARLDQSMGANMVSLNSAGTQISREELLFNRFIMMLRQRFSTLFEDILKTQLIMKGLMTLEEFEDIKKEIIYDFARDSFYAEMKDLEILGLRIQTLMQMQPLLNVFFSIDYGFTHVLKMTPEEIDQMKKEQQEDQINQANIQSQMQQIMGPPPEDDGANQPTPPPAENGSDLDPNEAPSGMAVPKFEEIEDPVLRRHIKKLFEEYSSKKKRK